MIKLKDNWLLYQVIVVYALYVLIGTSVPKPYISSATGIMSLIAGVVMCARYMPTAINILIRGRRGEYGAHNAILGAAELSLGLAYSGMFRLLWVYFQRPESWSSTMLSSLGLFMIAKGAWRMAWSPDEITPGHRFPEGFKVAVLIAFCTVCAFVAGTNYASLGQ